MRRETYLIKKRGQKMTLPEFFDRMCAWMERVDREIDSLKEKKKRKRK